MKGVNKIFIIFGLLVLFLFGGVWQLLQTEMFAKIISNHIQKKILDQQSSWHIAFSKLEVDMFPPATILKGVTFQYGKNDEVSLVVDSLGLYFSFWNLLSKDLSVDEIRVAGGELEAKNLFSRKATLKNISFNDIFQRYKNEIYREIPFNIKRFRLDNIELYHEKSQVHIEKLALDVAPYSFGVDADLFNIKDKHLKKVCTQGMVDELNIKLLWKNSGISVNSFSLKDALFSGQLNGSILAKEGRSPSVKLYSHFTGEISNLLGRIGLVDLSKELSGGINAKVEIIGDVENPDIAMKAAVSSFSSMYAFADSGNIFGGKKGDEIFIEQASFNSGKGRAWLGNIFKIYNLKEKEVIDQGITILAENLHTNKALYVVDDIMSSLKGYITGGVDISWENEVKVVVHENTRVSSVRLIFDDPTPVLQNKLITFIDGLFVVPADGPVVVETKLKFEDSDVEIKGTVGEKGVNFAGSSKRVDLVEFGPISGVQLYGVGRATVAIDGPFDDVKFRFNLEHENAEVFDFKLGKISTEFIFSLKEMNLRIASLRGVFGGTSYKGKGLIGFAGDFPLSLAIHVPKGSYRDSQQIYKSLFDLLDIYPKTLSFTYGGWYTVKGTVANHDYDVRGEAYAKNVWWMGEELDRVSGRFHYRNYVTTLEGLKMIKKDGTIQGDFSYNYMTDAIKYNATFKGIRCKDIYYYRAFNFGLDGEMQGQLKGQGDGKYFSSSSVIRIVKSRIGSEPVKNSLITIYNDSTDLFINGNVIGDLITFDSFFNLKNKANSKLSYLNISLQGHDIKTIAGLLSDHNKTDNSLNGRLYGSLNARFNLFDLTQLDLDVKLDDFRMRKDKIRLVLEDDHNSINIKGGKIKKWDLSLKGRNSFIKSFGEGSFEKKAKIINDFQLDSQLLTIFSPMVLSGKGRNIGNLVYIHNGKKFNVHMKLEGKGIGVKIKDLPSQFERINYKIILEDDEIIVDHIKGRYGGGSIAIDGNVEVSIPFPVLDLGVEIKRSDVHFFQKSSTTVTAKGSIKGSAFPYILSGHVFLNNTQVYDDINSLYKMSGAKGAVSKYLPAHALRNRVIYYNYDLDVSLDESAHVRNSMFDFFMNGTCHVGGTLNDLKTKGKFIVEPKMSKINFTGHDFVVDDGWFLLSDKAAPQYSFVASSKVNEYDVKLEAQGILDSIDIRLTSEPSLPQQDIVSLLTIGLTSDISQNLENVDRESMTSAGIGALLVDQLKISEGLNESLGLQLSVMPEYEQDDEASMLSGRTEGSNLTSGSVKSATKIKLQKKILGVDFSVSSTVGGSMKQKQEMKVKWNLLENMSLEGIYEIKASEDEEIDSNKSLGADVKLRWSF